MIIKILISVISIIIGYAGFVLFLVLQNYQAAIWAFFTGKLLNIKTEFKSFMYVKVTNLCICFRITVFNIITNTLVEI